MSQPTPRVMRDAYQNTLARLGLNQPNLLSASEYPLTRAYLQPASHDQPLSRQLDRTPHHRHRR